MRASPSARLLCCSLVLLGLTPALPQDPRVTPPRNDAEQTFLSTPIPPVWNGFRGGAEVAVDAVLVAEEARVAEARQFLQVAVAEADPSDLALGALRRALALLSPESSSPSILSQRAYALHLLTRLLESRLVYAGDRSVEADILGGVEPRAGEYRTGGADQVHLLHVPKTGGTSLRVAVEAAKDCAGRVVVHPHTARLGDLPAGAQAFAVLRDPVDRFLAAFRFFKEGGYRGAVRRRSDVAAQEEVRELLSAVRELVTIADRSFGPTHPNVARARAELAKFVWSFEGDMKLALELLESAAKVLSAVGQPFDEALLILLRQSMSHPIHAFPSAGAFVDALRGNDTQAWRALYCQENMMLDLPLSYLKRMKSACLFGQERDLNEMQFVFRGQAWWLDAADSGSFILRLIPFERLVAMDAERRGNFSSDPALLSSIGLPCETPLPHLNGRSQSTPPQSRDHLNDEQLKWIESLYRRDLELHKKSIEAWHS